MLVGSEQNGSPVCTDVIRMKKLGMHYLDTHVTLNRMKELTVL